MQQKKKQSIGTAKSNVALLKYMKNSMWIIKIDTSCVLLGLYRLQACIYKMVERTNVPLATNGSCENLVYSILPCNRSRTCLYWHVMCASVELRMIHTTTRLHAVFNSLSACTSNSAVVTGKQRRQPLLHKGWGRNLLFNIVLCCNIQLTISVRNTTRLCGGNHKLYIIFGYLILLTLLPIL